MHSCPLDSLDQTGFPPYISVYWWCLPTGSIKTCQTTVPRGTSFTHTHTPVLCASSNFVPKKAFRITHTGSGTSYCMQSCLYILLCHHYPQKIDENCTNGCSISLYNFNIRKSQKHLRNLFNSDFSARLNDQRVPQRLDSWVILMLIPQGLQPSGFRAIHKASGRMRLSQCTARRPWSASDNLRWANGNFRMLKWIYVVPIWYVPIRPYFLGIAIGIFPFIGLGPTINNYDRYLQLRLANPWVKTMVLQQKHT